MGCVPSLDVSDRRCPCPTGFRCEADRCIAGEPTDAGVDGSGDIDAGDAGSDGGFGQPDAAIDAGCTLPIPDAPPSPLRLRSGRLAMGANSSCFVRGTRLFCWGNTNDDGELDGVPSACGGSGCLREVMHPMGLGWTRVSVGNTHGCAIDERRALYCWGENDNLQLGDEDATGAVARVSNFLASDVSCSGNSTCAIKGDTRTILCWGRDISGQTGVLTDGVCSNLPERLTPTPLRIADSVIEACPPISDDPETGRWVEVINGEDTACGMLADGRAFCWGGTVQGVTGLPETDCKPGCRPNELEGTWAQVGQTQFFHRCGIRSSGELICFGLNGFGQLGIGSIKEDETPDIGPCTPEPPDLPVDAYDNDRGAEVLLSEAMPVTHPEGDAWAQVASGGFHTCALDGTGRVYCWGGNFARAVVPNTGDDFVSPARVEVPVSAPIEEVATGRVGSCVWTEDENVVCWGQTAIKCAGVDGCGTFHEIPFPP